MIPYGELDQRNPKCGICGADYLLHHAETLQCPKGGLEAPTYRDGVRQEWEKTTFAESSPNSFDAPHLCRIYVASSWKNKDQPRIVHLLRGAGHEVYDFRHPARGNDGFSWGEIDADWEDWTPEQYLASLAHPSALRGFGLDFTAMEWADTGIMVLPCGKSAHLEAGYFIGARKRLFILMLAKDTPELMYKMATQICTSEEELVSLVSTY